MKLARRFAFIPLLLAAVVGLHANDKTSGTKIGLSFGKEPLVYSIRITTQTKTSTSRSATYSTTSPYADNGAQVMSKGTIDARYKIRLTATGRTKDGVAVVRYEPFDYQADMDNTGQAGHFITTLHGLGVKSTQNGILVIDTDKEIGMTQAQAFKNGATLLLLSGMMDMSGNGDLKGFHGDLPFVDYWQEQQKTSLGLFSLRLPDHAVTNEESWEVDIPMKSSGALKFDAETLHHTNTFTLVENESADDPSLATIKISAPLNCHDLSGYLEERGESTHADLNELELTGLGVVHFDKKRGVIVDEVINKTLSTTMTVLIQGRAITSRSEIKIQTNIDLQPASTEGPDDGGEKSAAKNL